MNKIITYSIHRKSDGAWIQSRSIMMLDVGVWVCDDLEAGLTNIRVFIPYHNINQINEHTQEVKND
jgi:hypothetical protein